MDTQKRKKNRDAFKSITLREEKRRRGCTEERNKRDSCLRVKPSPDRQKLGKASDEKVASNRSLCSKKRALPQRSATEVSRQQQTDVRSLIRTSRKPPENTNKNRAPAQKKK